MTNDKPERRGPLDRAESIKRLANRARELNPTEAEINAERTRDNFAALFTAIHNYNQLIEQSSNEPTDKTEANPTGGAA